MPDNLAQKIIDDLEKVGFPAEVEISSELDKQHWIVYNGALFEDDEENKPREIDVHAVNIDDSLAKKVKKKVKEGDENKLIAHLVIEVKKSDKPWIFFDNGRTSWPQIPPQNFMSETEDLHYLLFDDLKKYGLRNHRYINAKFHKSYHVAFSKPTAPSVIYEALIKTSKALEYFKTHYGIGGYSFHLFIPIIVVDGSLWSANLRKNGKVKLKSVNNLFVTFGRLVKEEDGNFYEEEQICEVVTRSSFKHSLKVIEIDNREIYKSWTNYRIEKELSK